MPRTEWNELVKQWENVARCWAVRLALKPSRVHGEWLDQWHLICAGYNEGEPSSGDRAGCSATITVLHDGSNPLTMRTGEFLRVLAAHLRESHKGMSDTFPRKPASA